MGDCKASPLGTEFPAMSDGHVTWAERDRMAKLYQQGRSQVAMGLEIGRHPSTISPELRRNATGGEYLAAQEQEQTERRRRERLLTRKVSTFVAAATQAAAPHGPPSASHRGHAP